MAIAVAKIIAVARICNDLPGGSIHLAARHAGFGNGDASQLCFQDSVVNPLHLLCGVAQGHGTGHVGAVAFVENAKVHGDEVPLLQHPVAGNAMGHAGVGARHHNGVKGQAIGAVFIQAVNQLCAKLLLRHPHPDPGQDLGKGLVCDLLGLLHQAQLIGLFLGPESIDGLLAGLQGGGQLLFIGAELLHRQIALFKAQGVNAKLCTSLIDAGRVGVIPVHCQDLKALQILLSRLGIPAVCEIPAAGPGNQGHALGNVKLRRIVAAVPAGEQKAVQLTSQQGFVLIQIFHNCTFLPFAQNITGNSSTWRRRSHMVWL